MIPNERQTDMTIDMNSEKAPAAVRNERASLIALATMQGATFANVPGRYDGASDRRLAQALDVLDADEEAGSVETTGLHCARFGRFVRTTSEQGFVDVVAFATIPEAMDKMAEVEPVREMPPVAEPDYATRLVSEDREKMIAEAVDPRSIHERMGEAAVSEWGRNERGQLRDGGVMAQAVVLDEAAQAHKALEAVATLDADIEAMQKQDAQARRRARMI